VVIELLKFQVTPALGEKFVQKDAEISTQALATYPRFLSQEVWLNPKESTEIILVVRWETRETVEQVRKFPQLKS